MIKKLLSILTPGDRKKVLLLFCVNIASSMAGLMGIASIVPFISIISNPSKILTNSKWTSIFQYFNFEDLNSFVIYTGFLLLLIFISLILTDCAIG